MTHTLRTAAIIALNEIGEECGYHVIYKGIVRKRGWPEPSAKPWHIMAGNRLIASFKTLTACERNLRTRCGC